MRVQPWQTRAAADASRQAAVRPLVVTKYEPWLVQLTQRDATLIRMYAEGLPWKRICAQLGVSRATANRQLQYLLTVIAWHLNGRTIPTRWSRRYLLDRERELSRGDQLQRYECVRHLRIGQSGRAVRFTTEVGRIDYEDASTSRCHGEPANCEDAAKDRGP